MSGFLGMTPGTKPMPALPGMTAQPAVQPAVQPGIMPMAAKPLSTGIASAFGGVMGGAPKPAPTPGWGSMPGSVAPKPPAAIGGWMSGIGNTSTPSLGWTGGMSNTSVGTSVPTAPGSMPPTSGMTPTPSVPPPAPTGMTTGGMPPGYNDLRGQVINYGGVSGPNYGASQGYYNQANNTLGGIGNVAGPNFGQAQGYMGQAGNAVGDIKANTYGQIAAQNGQPTVDALGRALQTSNSGMSNDLRNMGMQSLQGLQSAPDRMQLAAQALQLQRQMTEPQWQQDLRGVGQKAAALGRVGAGMTTNELTDLTLAREKALGQYGQQAALDAAGQTMGDRLNTFGAISGYGNQIGSQDLQRAGFQQGIANNQFDIGTAVRNQQVGERGFQAQQGLDQAGLAAQRAGLYGNLGNMASQQAQATTDAGFNNANLGLAKAGAYAGIGNQLGGQAEFGANFGMQNAMNQANIGMQQQGRQDALAQQGISNAMQQQILQEQLLNGQFNRQLAGGQAGMQYGMANDPYGMQMQGAGMAGNSAAAQQQALAQQAQQEAMQRYFASGGQG